MYVPLVIQSPDSKIFDIGPVLPRKPLVARHRQSPDPPRGNVRHVPSYSANVKAPSLSVKRWESKLKESPCPTHVDNDQTSQRSL